jgi:hypothetical protein
MVNMENVHRVEHFLDMLNDEDVVLEDALRELRGDDPTVPNVKAVQDYMSWRIEQSEKLEKNKDD